MFSIFRFPYSCKNLLNVNEKKKENTVMAFFASSKANSLPKPVEAPVITTILWGGGGICNRVSKTNLLTAKAKIHAKLIVYSCTQNWPVYPLMVYKKLISLLISFLQCYGIYIIVNENNLSWITLFYVRYIP